VREFGDAFELIGCCTNRKCHAVFDVVAVRCPQGFEVIPDANIRNAAQVALDEALKDLDTVGRRKRELVMRDASKAARSQAKNEVRQAKAAVNAAERALKAARQRPDAWTHAKCGGPVDIFTPPGGGRRDGEAT
jgi:hypothetical protein